MFGVSTYHRLNRHIDRAGLATSLAITLWQQLTDEDKADIARGVCPTQVIDAAAGAGIQTEELYTALARHAREIGRA